MAEYGISKTTGKPKAGRQGEGGGPPKFKIDYVQAEKLATMQCTQKEIASFLGCSTDTLQRDPKFMEIYNAGVDKGRMSLRRLQWKYAGEGNTTMLVWLGKQYLGQRDTHEITGRDGEPLVPIQADDNVDLARRVAFMLTASSLQKASKSSKDEVNAIR